MTDQERKDVESLVYALARVQWGGASEQRCPLCGRAKTYGHTCGCPVNVAWKGARKQGWEAQQGQYRTAIGPVAECATCRWWMRSLGFSDLGVCHRQYQPESKCGSEDGISAIHTSADFGCVQWELRGL